MRKSAVRIRKEAPFSPQLCNNPGMGKQQKSEQKPNTGSDRASGKARKQNPKPNNYGATGRTEGGYSPAKLEERALKRKYAHLGESS